MEDKGKESIIYLNIMGGCGNQFFQYAFSRALQERNGGRLYIDYSGIATVPGLIKYDALDMLENFNANYYSTSPEIDRLFANHKKICDYIDDSINKLNLKVGSRSKYIYVKLWSYILEPFGIYYFLSSYHKFKYKKHKKIYIRGYFESPYYFEHIGQNIKKELTSKHPIEPYNIALYESIKNTESVCVTIKRKDLDSEDTAEIYAYDIDYYYSAVEYIKAHVDHPVFFVFSDNITWCKDNLNIDGDVYYETLGNHVWEKMLLMSACKHFIIRNSTFSWWAQWLSDNENKVVVAPSRWLNINQPIDLYDDAWIYMDDLGIIKETHE